jgi:uncharacterized membrane protein
MIGTIAIVVIPAVTAMAFGAAAHKLGEWAAAWIALFGLFFGIYLLSKFLGAPFWWG